MNLLSTLNLECLTTPPIWLMRQAGRYMGSYRAIREKIPSFIDLCLTPHLVCDITCQPVETFHMDAGILFSDILIIPYALGQSVHFVERNGPILGPLDRDKIQKVTSSVLCETLSPVFESISQLKQKPTFQNLPLIGFSGAPWTVSTYMVEGRKSQDHSMIKSIAFRDVGAQDALIEVLTQATVAFLKAQIDAGVDVIQIFDTWASALSSQYFERWCLSPLLTIAEDLKNHRPDIKIIYFPKGCSGLYPLLSETLPHFVDGINIDHNITPDFVKRLFGGRLAIQGGLDPVLLLTGGAACFDAVRDLLKCYKDVPYIFNLSHGVVPKTPEDNVDALVRQVKGKI